MRTDLPARLRIDAAFCEACDRPGDAGMAALLREAADELGWRPLETAHCEPPDSDKPPVRVLLWVEGGGGHGEGIAAFGHCYRSRDGGVKGVPQGYMGFTCTHWKPEPGKP